MCGEQITPSPNIPCLIGSPPRVRGTGPGRYAKREGGRITPACAGNSPSWGEHQRIREDHPRVCGEQSHMRPFSHGRNGSPPRVRGTDLVIQAGIEYVRITPACAGNSPLYEKDLPRSRDHPRVCGEQGAVRATTSPPIGSPPRVRGTVHGGPRGREGWGITPACAGNSISAPGSSPASGDHPRVCGEQAVALMVPLTVRGSPPRVRGTGQPKAPQTHGYRITPACAGNSGALHSLKRNMQDHPRVCGEQCRSTMTLQTYRGSPPRVRGTVFLKVCRTDIYRITPACAGNSRITALKRISTRDHPRVCGEQYDGFSAFSITVGSPPRVRGTVEK